MPDEYYPEMAAGDDEGAEPMPPEKEDAEPTTALLPKSLFGGTVKPGDTLTVKVSAVYEDEVEIETAGTEPESETPDKTTTPPPTADQEIDMMATEKGI